MSSLGVVDKKWNDAMFTLYQIDFRSGSGIDPIQCEQYLGKSNWTGPVWS